MYLNIVIITKNKVSVYLSIEKKSTFVHYEIS